MRRLATVIVILGLTLLVADCASPAPTPAPTPLPVAAPTTVPAPTAALVQPTATRARTAGELATLGMAVYKQSCGRCHDDPFAGPLSSGLRDFRTAQELLRFMQTRMPQDAAGSLPAEEYFYVLADILVDGKVVAADAELDVNRLADIALVQ